MFLSNHGFVIRVQNIFGKLKDLIVTIFNLEAFLIAWRGFEYATFSSTPLRPVPPAPCSFGAGWGSRVKLSKFSGRNEALQLGPKNEFRELIYKEARPRQEKYWTSSPKQTRAQLHTEVFTSTNTGLSNLESSFKATFHTISWFWNSDSVKAASVEAVAKLAKCPWQATGSLTGLHGLPISKCTSPSRWHLWRRICPQPAKTFFLVGALLYLTFQSVKEKKLLWFQEYCAPFFDTQSNQA